MLGRKDYTQEEVDRAKAAIAEQVAAYKKLGKALGATKDKKAEAALAAFEPLFFNNMVLALDRPFVHRIRAVTGKDGNPLNEVEMLGDSLMNNGGILAASTVIKLVPDTSVLQLETGDRIQLSESDFERLSAAFFAELERRFL
ncbi:MAG: hypothetical protein ACXVEY_13845 [Actinomycetota bacterium]